MNLTTQLFHFSLPQIQNAIHLPLALLLIFGTAKLFASLCERLGQPGLVGEIIAGVVLGPSLLNWVHPDEVLTALAELGVMFAVPSRP